MENIQRLNFETFFRSNQDTCLSQRPLAKQGQWIGKGQLLADCINSVKGDLSLGKNVLVAYMPWEGYNFEDSIVISDRLIAEDVYTSIHILRFRTEITNTLNAESKKSVDSNTKLVPMLNSNSQTLFSTERKGHQNQTSNLYSPLSGQIFSSNSSTCISGVNSSSPVLNLCSAMNFKAHLHNKVVSFAQGTPKVDKKKATTRESPPLQESLFCAELLEKCKKKQEDSEAVSYASNEIKDLMVRKLSKGEQSQKKESKNLNVFSGEQRTPNIPFLGKHLLSHLDHNGVAKIGTWLTPGDILVGKVRPLVNKFKSNRASTQLAWEIISSKKSESINVEDRSFRLPKGVFGRVIRTEIINHSAGEHVHVYLAVKRKIQIGDKLAGRHGNKGIVSLVLPKQDMPYIADGTPIDVILSPLGVPSRMNLGQIYECLLGLAAKALGCEFKIDNSLVSLMDENQSIQSLTDNRQRKFHTFKGQSKVNMYSFFSHKYNTALAMGLQSCQKKYALPQKQSTHSLRKRKEHFTPNGGIRGTRREALQKRYIDLCPLFNSNFEARNLVFLKLYHSSITCRAQWLFSVTHPGKMRLFDGRTGKPFASWVTVGYAYMLKLIHLVDNKIHSRSTGPYSLITRQPVTGKARQGGQRVGEMEAWALEGFGAAYTLQEFFAFKGDDASSRHQWKITRLSNLVGNTTAFKTLLSELKALCVSLDFTGYAE